MYTLLLLHKLLLLCISFLRKLFFYYYYYYVGISYITVLLYYCTHNTLSIIIGFIAAIIILLSQMTRLITAARMTSSPSCDRCVLCTRRRPSITRIRVKRFTGILSPAAGVSPSALPPSPSICLCSLYLTHAAATYTDLRANTYKRII